MNAHAMGAPLRGRALYKRRVHRVAQTAFGLMLLLYLAGLVAVVDTFVVHPLGWRDVAGLFMMIVFPLVIGTNLRTWALFGSVEGLEIVRWGRRRVVPWSKVGKPQYVGWSVHYAARLACVTLHEGKDRTILFFADDRSLVELEGMRALYAHRSHQGLDSA